MCLGWNLRKGKGEGGEGKATWGLAKSMPEISGAEGAKACRR